MNKTEKFWDKLAKDVDENSDLLDKEQLKTIKDIEQYIKNDSIILDYGCARGGIALELSTRVKEVQGIDISSKMIQIAAKRAASRNIRNAHFTHTVITDCTFKPETFDVILALNTFHLVEGLEDAIKQLATLLKPGGILISQTPCLGERSSLVSFMASSLLWMAVKSGFLPTIGFYKGDNLKNMMNHAGLEIVETRTIKESLSTSYFFVARRL